MDKFVEASVIVFLTVAVTAAVMVLVVPVRAFGGSTAAEVSRDVRPAVYVESLGNCPAGGLSAERCPALARVQSDIGCPYLERAAASGCPALMESGAPASCTRPAVGETPKSDVKIARAGTFRGVEGS
jgi:hypothetical protein